MSAADDGSVRAPSAQILHHLDFLAGGGETGALMRAIDWSKTPLGAVDTWPQSLRTCIRIILTSRQPMFVWWGDALINLYNDAYKAIVGGKHPEALGQPASVVWREIWAEIGPRAASAMRNNEGTYDEALLLIMERNGYAEETYYTFSYSPVPNDQGGTGGIICANTNDTQRIIGERQISLLRELAARTAHADTFEHACTLSAACLEANAYDLPFALLYVADPANRHATLAASSGIAAGHAAAPTQLGLDGDSVWPLGEVLDSHEARVVEGLDRRFADLPAGPWPQPPTRALVIPVMASSRLGRAGILIVGLNPFRLVDDGYRGFLSLVAGQISASIANAEAREEEKRRADALAEIDRAKTVFFSNVSHEFRTPLTLMLGPTEDALATPEQALLGEDLKTVHRNELRLLKLVNQLLDFSRIEAGRITASYEPTDLSSLTVDLASAFRSAMERGGLRFEVDCPPLPEPVYVDREMWEKIVLNLVSNAFKFTLEGSVRVGLHALDDHVELTVADTGGGIPEAELPRLFDRFHRVENTRSRTHEGSGIGLALVHDLVRLLGGTIDVESELGRGTTFAVAIPKGSAHLPATAHKPDANEPASTARARSFVAEALRWLPSNDSPSSPHAQAAESAPTARSQARILVADDNADMRDYVTRLLSQHWVVDAVADGAQALAAARSRRPDLVLADVMMPELDGFALVRELRADARTAPIPIILLSARAGEEATAEGLRSGADDYVVKPFSSSSLLVRVESALAAARVRAAATAAAERERKSLYSLFMTGPAAIALLRGPELIVELANHRMLEVWGKTDAIVGKPLMDALPELRGQPYPEILREVLRSGTAYHAEGASAMLDRNRDGQLQQLFFDFSYEPVRDNDGHVDGILVFAVEVTQEVLARRATEAALREAETANRAKDEFLAILGHELRNPLAPITTALHLMRLRAGDVALKERAVIERQVNHLARLVDDLLDVSRITRGKVELKKRPLEIAEIVARAIELASPLLEQRQHQLRITVPAHGLTVTGDSMRLAQTVSNLIMNAAKYTEHGGEIDISAGRDGDQIFLIVRDNGIGIDPEVLPRIFDLFVQDRQALDRSQGGLGLGLAIVRSLVAMHGGGVTARSEGKGRGSEFEIRLPATIHDADARAPLARSQSPTDSSRREALRILVVDDNEDGATLLAETLAELGYETRVAHDGPEALRVAAEFAPDVGLLDIGLPLMDGYELARRLRELEGLAGPLRLVAVTGYGQAADRDRAKRAGFDAHLVKPVQLDQLASVIKRSEE